MNEDFIKLMVDQTPKFDEMILEQIRPQDDWVLHVATGPCGLCEWFDCREAVRKLSEGKCYRRSRALKSKLRPIPMGTPVELTQDQFRSVWPKVWSTSI